MTRSAQKYIERKKRKKRARIVAAVSSCGLFIMIMIALCLLTVDRFTITTLDDKDLSLSIDETREKLTTELHADPLLEAMDTQYTDIPENIDEGLGSKNTDDYFAYSFYLIGRASVETINYSLTMELKETSDDLLNAMKVMIIKDGRRSIYARANEDGTAKPLYSGTDHLEEPEIIGSTIPFKENKHIILEPYKINSGEYCKYTIVMWIDGWESHDYMKGGVVDMNMTFSTISKNDNNNL